MTEENHLALDKIEPINEKDCKKAEGIFGDLEIQIRVMGDGLWW